MKRKTRADYNYERYAALRMRLIDTYRKHVQFKSTHVVLLEDVTRLVWNDPKFARLPQYYRGCLREVSRVWSDRIYELHLDWRLGPASGPVRTAADAWTDEMSELSRTPGALFGAHYWRDSDRLYGAWKAVN